MTEIVVKFKIPKELEHLKDRIEKALNEEVKDILRKFEALERARGCLKTDKTWKELEAEMYEGIYEDFCR